MKEKILALVSHQSHYNLLDYLERDFEIIWRENQRQGIEYLEKHGQEIALILLEIFETDMRQNALPQYLEQTKMRKCMPVIIIGDIMLEGRNKGTHFFWADDMIEKTVPPEIAVRRIHNVLELYQYRRRLETDRFQQEEEHAEQYEGVREYSLQIEELFFESLNNRNVENYLHIQYVEAYARILAEHYAVLYPRSRMTDNKIEMIARAARLHDIGKMMLPDFIVARPGRLSDSEFGRLKEHTAEGCRIADVLLKFESERMRRICYNVCRYHHERYDGSGYPDSLQKEKFPVEAQIVALADMYDILVNARSGYPENSKEYAYYMLMNGEYGELSPRMKECFKDAKENMEALSLDVNLKK